MALWNKQKILHDHRRTISWLLLGMEMNNCTGSVVNQLKKDAHTAETKNFTFMDW